MNLGLGLRLGAFSRGGGGFLPARDGTASVNLGAISNFMPSAPILNMLKNATEWEGNVTGSLAEGDIDANGYPTAIPATNANIQVGWTWNGSEYAPLKDRNLVAVTTGDATWTMAGSVAISSSSANRQVFQVTGGNTFRMEVSNLGTTGIGDAYVVFEEYEDDLLAGEVWNPEFLRLLRRDYTLGAPFQMRDLRFMDWMQTNGSSVVDYDDHPSMDDFRWWGNSNNINYNGIGVPILAMINLCNKVGANPWFCIPHRATNAYVEALAADIRDNLNSNLKCTLEYSNETWNNNPFFPQSFYCAAKGINEWGTTGTGTITVSAGAVTGTGTAFTTELAVNDYLAGPDGAYLGRVSAIASDTALTLNPQNNQNLTDVAFQFDTAFPQHDWSTKRSVQLAYLFDAELGNDARRKHVLGTQYSQTSVTTARLEAALWLSAEGAATGGDPFTGWVDPATVFDYVATAPYFANSALSEADWEAILDTFALDPDDGALALSVAIDEDAGPTAINNAFTSMQAQFDIVRAAGLEVIQYEAGQHITPPTATDATQKQAVEDLVRYYFTTSYGEANLAFWGQAVKAFTDGPVNWFNLDVRDDIASGTWALFPGLGFAGDEKTTFFNEVAQAPRWFGSDTPPVFTTTLPEITGQATVNIGSANINLRNFFSANYVSASISGIDGVSIAADGSLSGAPTTAGTGTYTVTLTNPAGSTQATGALNIAAAPTLPVPEMVTFNGSTHFGAAALTGRTNTTKMSGLLRFQRTATTNGYSVGGSFFPFDILHGNNTLRLRLYNPGGTNFYSSGNIGSGLSDGNPHTMHWSYDGATGAIKIVIDGTTLVNTTTTADTIRGASWQCYLGIQGAGSGTAYTGDLERVTIWDNVALDVLDSGVRSSMDTPASAGGLGNNIVDYYGPPATWNAGTNSGTGGDFGVITGAVT